MSCCSVLPHAGGRGGGEAYHIGSRVLELRRVDRLGEALLRLVGGVPVRTQRDDIDAVEAELSIKQKTQTELSTKQKTE